MIRFEKTRHVALALIATAAFSLTGCGLLNKKSDDGGGDAGGGGAAVDMAKMMKDSAEAPYKVGIHAGAEVGQWAQWADGSGAPNQWWGVTGEKDGNQVVEMRMKTGESWITYAYVVDGEGLVQEAYIANYNPDGEPEAGYKIKVGAKPEGTAGGEGPTPETGEETVNAAGKDWNCKWTLVDAGGKPSKSWMCEDLWFTKMVKSEYDGKVTMQLKEIGTDATLGLKFPG